MQWLQRILYHGFTEWIRLADSLFAFIKIALSLKVTYRAKKTLLWVIQKLVHLSYIKFYSLSYLHNSKRFYSSRNLLAIWDLLFIEFWENILRENLHSDKLIKHFLVNLQSFLKFSFEIGLVLGLSPHFVHLKLIAILATWDQCTWTHFQINYLRRTQPWHSKALY